MKNTTVSESRPLGGWLIFSACLLLLLSFGYRSGFGLFVKPITEANGWGREVISVALAVQNLFWGIVAVFAGGIADRFGNVKVIVVGTILYALGMLLMSGVDDPWTLNASAGLLAGAGVAGTSFGIILPAMARAVGEERRQWALGLGTAAGSIGQFAVVPLAQMLIDAFGWATALNILAGSSLSMALLAMPLAPYSGKQEAVQRSEGQTVRQALQEAFGYRSYVLLVTGFFVCGFHVAFITAHMPAFLSDIGFDAGVGAWSISIIGLCNVFGAYLSGVLSGRILKRHVLVMIYLGRAAAITLFLMVPHSLGTVYTFSAVMGFLWLATVPATSGLVAVMFGTRYMALLYGFVFLGHQIGSFIGVWLGGWLFDRSGSYDVVWWLAVALGIMAAIVHWPIEERPVQRLAVQST
ncbi:MAG: MFS transporter [Deltaproteobacteria bacterium SG8_13]|nr:MAG: MFS transporter [Deltaproteobacteria bacterium SG8_13]